MVLIGTVARIPIPNLVPAVFDVLILDVPGAESLQDQLAKLEGKQVIFSVRELVTVEYP